jgi:hypothetical protein
VPANASQRPIPDAVGGRGGGPVDASTAWGDGAAEGARATGLGDATGVDVATGVAGAGAGRALPVAAARVAAADGEGALQTAAKETFPGAWLAPTAYRHPSMSPSCSADELAPTTEVCQPAPWRWKYCQ